MFKKIWKNLLAWLKEYKQELVLLLVAVGLILSVQLIGCNEVAFRPYQPPQGCDDFGLLDLDDANCKEKEGPTTGGTSDIGDPGPYKPARGQDDLPTDFAEELGSGDKKFEGSSQSRPGSSVIEFSNTYYMGVVDIIFVIDNSRSMYVEQQNIANQFDQFLDSIQYLDYHIAIMTVDTSDSPDNKDRTYQDGHFIRFSNGRKYLANEDKSRSQHRDNIRMFKAAVQRPESIECTEEGKANECPDDERAICALNKSLDISSQQDFFRKPSHLMVIILSDEDERSSEEYRKQQWDLNRIDYGLRSCDNPQNFYSKVTQRLGVHIGISVHAIIIPPGDEDCLAEQDEVLGKGYYGHEYKKFARPSGSVLREYPYIVRGQVLSICDRNYGSQLGRLSEYLQEPLPITLPCEPFQVQNVRLLDDDGSSENVRYELEGKNLTVLEDQVSLSSRIRVNILCSAGS